MMAMGVAEAAGCPVPNFGTQQGGQQAEYGEQQQDRGARQTGQVREPDMSATSFETGPLDFIIRIVIV